MLTPDGEVVVSGVAPGEAAAISVSPAQTALLVTDGDEPITEAGPASFERGQAYTVVVLEGEDGVRALILTASAN